MTRTALAIAAGLCLLAAGSAYPAPGQESPRDLVLAALAAQADLPAEPPALPSLLAERDALPREGAEGREKGARRAAQEARGAARSDAAKAAAAAARSEAARAARGAKEDARGASERLREENTRKKPKPPRPGGGGSP